MKNEDYLENIVRRFRLDASKVDLGNLEKMIQVVSLKDRYDHNEDELESERVERELHERMADAVNQYVEEYMTLFHHNKQHIEEDLLTKNRENLKKDFKNLFKEKKGPVTSRLKSTLENENFSRAHIEEIGNTIMDSVSNSINVITETIKKKMNKTD